MTGRNIYSCKQRTPKLRSIAWIVLFNFFWFHSSLLLFSINLIYIVKCFVNFLLCFFFLSQHSMNEKSKWLKLVFIRKIKCSLALNQLLFVQFSVINTWIRYDYGVQVHCTEMIICSLFSFMIHTYLDRRTWGFSFNQDENVVSILMKSLYCVGKCSI